MHFKGFQRAVGMLKGPCDLLEGNVNCPAVMKELRETGYEGPRVVEFFGLEAAALGRLSQAMDKILAM